MRKQPSFNFLQPSKNAISIPQILLFGYKMSFLFVKFSSYVQSEKLRTFGNLRSGKE